MMATLYYRRLPTGELVGASTESDGGNENLRIVVIDSVDATMMGGGNLPDLDRMFAKFEEAQRAENRGPFSDPWQRRPSREKNRSPQHLRVEKRRRRTKLAKLTRKQMRDAEKRRELERAELARKK